MAFSLGWPQVVPNKSFFILYHVPSISVALLRYFVAYDEGHGGTISESLILM